MPESAFKGTVKEGFERRFTIINERDIEKYVPEPLIEDLNASLHNALVWVEEGRKNDGKHPFNNYLIINLDEPYAPEVIEIMKRHGHWG